MIFSSHYLKLPQKQNSGDEIFRNNERKVLYQQFELKLDSEV